MQIKTIVTVGADSERGRLILRMNGGQLPSSGVRVTFGEAQQMTTLISHAERRLLWGSCDLLRIPNPLLTPAIGVAYAARVVYPFFEGKAPDQGIYAIGVTEDLSNKPSDACARVMYEFVNGHPACQIDVWGAMPHRAIWLLEHLRTQSGYYRMLPATAEAFILKTPYDDLLELL